MNKRFAERPALVVGVTGHMCLSELPPEDQAKIRESVEQVLRSFRSTASRDTEWVPASGEKHQSTPNMSDQPLLLGLQATPVTVLTALAPGADTLVADIAEDLQRQWDEDRLRNHKASGAVDGSGNAYGVVAVLPFPIDQYARATTFESVSEELRDAVHRRLKQLGDHDQAVFVKLAEDADFSLDELRKEGGKTESDLLDKCRRRLRYRAAGEYVAAFSHVLLALTNDDVRNQEVVESIAVPLLPDCNSGSDGAESTLPGASSILEIKRRGTTPGLLWSNPSFTWVNTGPVIHIYTPRPDQARNSDKDPPAGTITYLYPADLKPHQLSDTAGTMSNLDSTWRSHGAQVFLDNSTNLERFNTEALLNLASSAEAALDEGKHYDRMLGDVLATRDEQTDNEVAAKQRQALDRLARMRCRAARRARDLAKRIDRTMSRSFLLTAMAAVCLHLAFHWHPGSHPTDDHKSVNQLAVQTQGHQRTWLNTIFQLASIGFLVTAIRLFTQVRGTTHENERLDCRALSEGLRVQFYWSAAGLQHSVPANYMHRQRAELNWIRLAISSLANPYYRWHDRFREMTVERRVRILQSVRERWVEEQRRYFVKTACHYFTTLHFWHIFGYSLALGGAVLAALHVLYAEPLELLVHDGRTETIIARGGVVSAAIFLILWIWGSWSTTPFEEQRHGQILREHSHNSTSLPIAFVNRDKLTLRIRLWTGFQWMWMFLDEVSARSAKGIVGLRLLLPVSMIVLTSWMLWMFAHDFAVRRLHLNPPDAQTLCMTSCGLLLLFGAMAVAWAEKNLYAEHSRQFSSMADVFLAARRRIDGHLMAIENNPRSPDVLKRIEAIQDILHALGQQALDENAEWLILHRSRPLEPVLAG